MIEIQATNLGWSRCVGGYRVDFAPIRGPRSSNLPAASGQLAAPRRAPSILDARFLTHAREPLCIAANDTDFEPVAISANDIGIALEFARSVPQPGAHKQHHRLLQFVSRYGLPTRARPEASMRLPEYEDAARRVRRALYGLAKPHPEAHLGGNQRILTLNAKFCLADDSISNEMKFGLAFPDLWGVLWYQVALIAHRKVPIAICPQCGGPYRRLGRRLSCSDACKQRKSEFARATASK